MGELLKFEQPPGVTVDGHFPWLISFCEHILLEALPRIPSVATFDLS